MGSVWGKRSICGSASWAVIQRVGLTANWRPGSEGCQPTNNQPASLPFNESAGCWLASLIAPLSAIVEYSLED